ncbi:MAG: o-succinylbenzoate--CoA ligase [Chloroflexota bacterium]|nr:MAG: o-succinylbenzoate--CoA ligase [Chloroflexota bacterium]
MLISDIIRQNAWYFPNHPCLIQGDVRLTQAEVNQRSNALANALMKLGVNKGDRLAILTANCYNYPEIYFTVAKAGIIGVPLNVRLAVPELRNYLRYTKPKALIVSAAFAEAGKKLAQEVPGLEHVIGLGAEHPFNLNYDALIRESSKELPQVSVSPNDPYVLGATSGTTGIPKGAILTQRNAVASMMIWTNEIAWPQFGAMLQAIPQFFNPGGPANMIPLIKAGAVIVLPDFSPQVWMETVQKERPFHSILVPTMLNMVVSHPDVSNYDLSSLKAMCLGGSPLSQALLKRAIEVFGNIFYPIYGMCETYSNGTILRRADLVTEGTPAQLKRLGSVGLPIQNVEVRVVNDKDEDIAWGTGEVGEIIIRGDQVSDAYWDMPEETADSHKNGWFYTGDVGTQDQEGYIFLVDRKKDMIITGGINVYSVEVEAAISLHPAVMQVAVIGVPDQEWGEAVKAIIVLKPGASATEEEIIQHCKEELASYKKPKSVEFRESLPVGGTGKILKKDLREPYWAGQEKRIH